MMAKLLLAILRVYQLLISPFLGPCCRFYPSCSNYCMDSIRHHGTGKGLYFGLVRLLKCHPFHPGGVDLVPAHTNRSDVPS